MSQLDYLLLGVIVGVLLAMRRPITMIITPPPSDVDRSSGMGCMLPILMVVLGLAALVLVGGM